MKWNASVTGGGKKTQNTASYINKMLEMLYKYI